jgi:formylglycine-generating enzyme required for sulfatase activity
MENKKTTVIASLITMGLVMTAAVPVLAQEVDNTNLSSAGHLAREEITVMLPGDVPLVMVRIPAGTFLMGSPEGERGNVFDNETQHQVTLTQDYYLGKTEVTQQQWQAVMGTPMRTECGTDGVGDDYPVFCVTWRRIAGAGGFLEKLNQQQGTTSFRLPTEAEWERAMRAGTTTRFSHGDVLHCGDDCEACADHEPFMWWCGDDSPTGPKPVGQKQQNQFGLLDMHGNIFEIVNDLYGEFSSAPVTDPTGPTTGFDIVIKGGSWENEAWLNRSAVRISSSPDDRAQNNSVGFRLAATAPAAAALEHRSFFPAVAVAAGSQGAFFQSDVDLNNTAPADGKTTEMDVQYELWWLPRGKDNSDPVRSDKFSLASGQSVRIENVLTEIFGLEPDEVGALAIAASNPYLIGMSRTYNIPAAKIGGTFGQALPAVPEDELIQSGDSRRIIFMSENADFRANLGCVNGTDMAMQILIDLYDASGTLLETKTMNLGPWSNKQFNRIFRAYQPVNGYVDVRSDTEGAEYSCYGSVLHEVTSGPTTILPQMPSSGMRYYVPAAALAAGAEGAFFQTDVDVNNSGMDSSYVFMWLPRGQDNSSPAQSDSWNLGSGMSARYENALSEFFAAEPNVVGALGMQSPSEDLLSMSRIYNVPAGKVAGTFGQALPGIQEGDMIGANDRRRIIFLSEDSDLRTNVGCASGSGVTTRIKIELFNAAGESLATRNMELGPWSNKQLNRIFRDFSPVNGYVDVSSETEGALFYCYGSVLDTVTSDPTTILPQ